MTKESKLAGRPKSRLWRILAVLLIALAACFLYLPQFYSVHNTPQPVLTIQSTSDRQSPYTDASRASLVGAARQRDAVGRVAELEKQVASLQLELEGAKQDQTAAATSARRPVPRSREDLDSVHADGFFNSHPLRYRSPSDAEASSYHSTSHCIGENFLPETSWTEKSCQFRNLCFDVRKHEFVLFASPEQVKLERVLENQKLTSFTSSTSMVNNVSIGGLNAKWTKADQEELRWFPKVLKWKEAIASGFYELPDDSVMVPFHSMAGQNPGHLVWDDWLPIYSLLTTFEMLHKRQVFMRFELPGRGLWAS